MTLSQKAAPALSIVIPTLNQGAYLEQAITSLLEQAYPNLELLVVDGGSDDESAQILEKYANDIFWYCSEPDGGQTNALNKGFSKTTGEILGWLNADDQSAPGALARVAAYFLSHPDVDAVYGHRVLIDEWGHEIGRWILPPHSDKVLTWCDFVPQESLFWRRSLWDRIDARLNESFSFAMDWDLLLRFREVGARIVRLPYFLGYFRVHVSQKTLTDMQDIGLKEMEALRARTLGYPPPQFRITMGVIPYLLQARLLEIMWKVGLIRYT